MLTLLTPNDQAKLTLLEYFENHNDTIIPLWQLEELLSLSPFKTSNIINELADELTRFSSGFIELIQNKNVTSYHITSELINKFKLYYLKSSPIFRIYSFFYRGELNFPFLIKEIGISQASAYKHVSQLNSQLKQFDIKIQNRKLQGPERTIRLKTFEVLIFFFKGIESPFEPKLIKTTKQFLYLLTKQLNIPASHSMMLKLEYFISISLLRIEKGSVLTETGAFTLTKNQNLSSERLYSVLISTFKQLFPKITTQTAQLESLYLIAFLAAESLLTDSEMLEGFSNTSQLTEKADNFITHIKKACGSEEIFESISQPLHREALASFIKHEFFNYRNDSFNDDLVNQQFTELYVAESNLIREFIFSQTGETELSEETLPLFYDLLFLIITLVPDNAFQKPLHICVDFSRSLTYTQHIKNKISAFDSLKVIFESVVTDKTDLYVSDFANYQIKTPQIIWKDPPSVNDWRLFGDTLIEIRKEIN